MCPWNFDSICHISRDFQYFQFWWLYCYLWQSFSVALIFGGTIPLCLPWSKTLLLQLNYTILTLRLVRFDYKLLRLVDTSIKCCRFQVNSCVLTPWQTISGEPIEWFSLTPDWEVLDAKTKLWDFLTFVHNMWVKYIFTALVRPMTDTQRTWATSSQATKSDLASCATDFLDRKRPFFVSSCCVCVIGQLFLFMWIVELSD